MLHFIVMQKNVHQIPLWLRNSKMTKSTLQSLCKPGRIPSREKIPAPHIPYEFWIPPTFITLLGNTFDSFKGNRKQFQLSGARSEGNKMGEEYKDHAHLTSRAARDILILWQRNKAAKLDLSVQYSTLWFELNWQGRLKTKNTRLFWVKFNVLDSCSLPFFDLPRA